MTFINIYHRFYDPNIFVDPRSENLQVDLAMSLFTAQQSQSRSTESLIVFLANKVGIEAMGPTGFLEGPGSMGYSSHYKNNGITIYMIYLENQNPKNSSGQRKNLRYFGKNKKTSVFD